MKKSFLLLTTAMLLSTSFVQAATPEELTADMEETSTHKQGAKIFTPRAQEIMTLKHIKKKDRGKLLLLLDASFYNYGIRDSVERLDWQKEIDKCRNSKQFKGYGVCDSVVNLITANKTIKRLEKYLSSTSKPADPGEEPELEALKKPVHVSYGVDFWTRPRPDSGENLVERQLEYDKVCEKTARREELYKQYQKDLEAYNKSVETLKPKHDEWRLKKKDVYKYKKKRAQYDFLSRQRPGLIEKVKETEQTFLKLFEKAKKKNTKKEKKENAKLKAPRKKNTSQDDKSGTSAPVVLPKDEKATSEPLSNNPSK